MEFDPANVLFGAVVVLLGVVLLGVIYAARDRRAPVSEGELDDVYGRLEAIGPEIVLLAAQIHHPEEVEGLQREVAQLRVENQRPQQEYRRTVSR